MPELFKPQPASEEREPRSPSPAPSLHLSDVSDEEDRQLLVDDTTMIESCNQQLSSDYVDMIKTTNQNRILINSMVEEDFIQKVESQKQKIESLQAVLLQNVECEPLSEPLEQQDAAVVAFAEIGKQISQTMNKFTASEQSQSNSTPHEHLITQIVDRSEHFEVNLQKQEELSDKKIIDDGIELAASQKRQQEKREAMRELIEAEDRAEREKQAKEMAQAEAESKRMRIAERGRLLIIQQNREKVIMECCEADTKLYISRLQQTEQRNAALSRARKLAAEQEFIEEQDTFIANGISTLRQCITSCYGEIESILSQCSSLKKLHSDQVSEQRDLYTTCFAEKNCIIKIFRSEANDISESFENHIESINVELINYYSEEKKDRQILLTEESQCYEELVLNACGEQAAVHRVVIQSQLESKKRLSRHKAATTTASEIELLRNRTGCFFKKSQTKNESMPWLAALQSLHQNLSKWRDDGGDGLCVIETIRRRKVSCFAASPKNNCPISEELTTSHPFGITQLRTRPDNYIMEGYDAMVFCDLSSEEVTLTRKIKKINLSGNRISSIAIQQGDLFINCEEISVSDNSLDANCFSQLISSFGNVKKIVADSNRISSIPMEMSCLRNLHILSLRSNCLSDSSAVVGCNSLHTLDLLGNNLLDFNLDHLSTLTFLNLSRNALRTVNSVFLNCPILRSCHLNNNRIHSLPIIFRSVLLQELWIGDNELVGIPDLTHLPLLEVLYLQGNMIEDVTGIKNCQNLTFFDISFNKLSDVGNTTNALRGLKKLSRLSINENPIWNSSASLIEPILLENLPALRILNSDPVDPRTDITIPTEKVSDLGIELALYPGVCGIQNEDFAGLKKKYVTRESEKEVAYAVETATLCEQSYLLHSKGNVKAEGISRIWRTNQVYADYKNNRRRHNASGTIARWFKTALVQQKRNTAARRIQRIVRGSLLRWKLTRGKWIDEDAYNYSQIDEPEFSPEIDTSQFEDMGKILTDALQKQAGSQNSIKSPTAPPPPQPPPPPVIVPTPPRVDSFRSTSESSNGCGSHSPHSVMTAEEDSVPLSGATLAWSAGMNKRVKKFQTIKKKRLAEERFLLDKNKTLDNKQAVIRRTVSDRSRASAKPQPRPPNTSNRCTDDDLEVESMNSTTTSSMRRGSLPPLQSDSSSEAAKK